MHWDLHSLDEKNTKLCISLRKGLKYTKSGDLSNQTRQLCIMHIGNTLAGGETVVAGERGTTAAYLQEINICAYIDKLAFSNLFATEAFPVPFCLQELL